MSRDLRALPKAHLHVHVESTLRPATLRELAADHGVAVPAVGGAQQAGFDGFRAFADQNALIRDCLRRPADFERLAREYCEDEAAQGVGYAEVTFTAASHGERLGRPEMPLEALLRGLSDGCAATGLECRVLLDHSRRRSVERFRRTYELARHYAGHGVIGIGLAGDETHPAAPFAEICSAAERAGLHRVHHAGETAGPASIREALGPGRSERLGHGIRILDDPALVAEVAERGVPLEVCPSSNVALGLARSWAEHPLPRLRDAGLTVTLNTDIPISLGVTLSGEYARARVSFGWSDHVLAELARASVTASFAPEPSRRRLLAGIDRWLGRADRPADGRVADATPGEAGKTGRIGQGDTCENALTFPPRSGTRCAFPGNGPHQAVNLTGQCYKGTEFYEVVRHPPPPPDTSRNDHGDSA